MDVLLRPARVSDAEEFRVAHDALLASDDFELGLSYDPDEPFDVFVDRQRDLAIGKDMPDGLVPATFLVATVHDEIVGRSSIRHEMNDFLRAEGGHIGYGVLEQHRGQGIATEILRQSLIIARSLGIETALLMCDADNLASATVIERCGGLFQDAAVASDGVPIHRYAIPLL